MPDEQQNYKAFRQRLDAVLRRRDPDALREFLVAEGQWQPETQTDTEAAMWMMIAASPVLKDMRPEAERWLLTHGHEAEAGAILGTRRTAPTSAGPNCSPSSQRPSSGTHPRRAAPAASHPTGKPRPQSRPNTAPRPGPSSTPRPPGHASRREDRPPGPPAGRKPKPPRPKPAP